MKFFHVYNDQYFAGLEKNGLLDEDSGFKIQHVFSLPQELKFNRVAAVGTPLYRYIQENRFPFYVDRIAGGVTYHSYDFDKKLIGVYRELLGEWFLGFQQHETAGNRRLDWQRALDRMDGNPGPWDAAELRKRSVRDYAVTPEGEVLSGFSQGTPEEYAAFPYPETLQALLADYRRLFVSRMAATDGMILPCDSFQLLTRMQDELGMQTFMPEVGCQIPQMRIAVALARGTAKARKKKWGIYYECWRTTEEGSTMPCFNTEPGNEWYLTQESHKDDFTSYGPNGGSSRLLQKRIFYYALMAGAQLFAEEWGLNCSYLEMRGEYPLSPYGEVKKELIGFARSHRSVKARVPFAVVLPKEIPFVQLTDGYCPNGARRKALLRRELSPSETEAYGLLEEVLKLLFERAREDIHGNEGHVLQNSRFGDLFDLVYEDAPTEAFRQYDLLIDPSRDGHIAARLGGEVKPVRYDGDPEKLAQVLNRESEKRLPLTVDRFLWLLSEDENGSCLTGLNNEGNERSVEWGDRPLHEADGVARIRLARPAELSVLFSSDPGVRLERRDAQSYALFLPANSLAVLSLS